MSDTNGASNPTSDIAKKLQELLTSHEMLLTSQESLLGGYQALQGAIKAIIEANDRKSFLSEDLRQKLYEALNESNNSLTSYLEDVQKSRHL